MKGIVRRCIVIILLTILTIIEENLLIPFSIWYRGINIINVCFFIYNIIMIIVGLSKNKGKKKEKGYKIATIINLIMLFIILPVGSVVITGFISFFRVPLPIVFYILSKI